MEDGRSRSSVLITDGNTRSALAIARSLGGRGNRIIMASDHPRSIAFYSKHCDQRFLYPSPIDDKEAFIESISTFLERNDVDLLIPVSDKTCYPIVENKAKLKDLTCVACPDKEMMEEVFDKSLTLRTAIRLGVPVPETYFIENIENIFPLAQELRYPVVIKPRWSWYWKDGKAKAGVRRFVSSEEELLLAYQEMNTEIPLPMIQEVVRGDGVGLFALTENGVPLATFAHHRLREVNPSGGASTLREGVPTNGQVKEHGLGLLREIGWNGVAMVEFKLDARTNVPKLMEINGRFWGSLDLAARSGVDFPFLLFQQMMGERPDGPMDYRSGHRSRWVKGDLERMVHIFKDPERSIKEKLRSLTEALNFWSRDVSYDVLKLDDPWPGLIELLEFIDDFVLHRSRTKGNKDPETRPILPYSFKGASPGPTSSLMNSCLDKNEADHYRR